jgi:hypothetical protein
MATPRRADDAVGDHVHHDPNFQGRHSDLSNERRRALEGAPV